MAVYLCGWTWLLYMFSLIPAQPPIVTVANSSCAEGKPRVVNIPLTRIATRRD